jgi:hypothetical protein
MSTQDRPQYELMLEKALNARHATFSRRGMLRTTAIAGAGLAAVSITGISMAQAAATPVATPSSPFKNDADVLNYALTLEHLESSFYRDGLKSLGTAGFTALGFQSGVFDYLSEIASDEAAHVTTLTKVISGLGATPVAEAKYDFGYSDAAGFLGVAMALEDTGVSAYGGAAQYLMDNGDLLTAALTIHGVEARHASYLAVLNGKNPFPDAFNPALTPSQVLDIAGPFIKS